MAKHLFLAALVLVFAAVALSEDCPVVCPLLFGPVCGSDGAGNQKTFDNHCLYKVHNCQQRKSGLPTLPTMTNGACP